MRIASDADAEREVLATEAGSRLLNQVALVPRPSPRDLERWRKEAPADLVSAALRIVATRRRGASKFTRAGRMWFEPVALEQATAEPVARHKARRFAGADVIDLCSGIGGDSLALGAVARRVAAVDRDAGMLRRLLWNAREYEVGDSVMGALGDAERFPLPATSHVHIDPDRRAEGGARARAIGRYVPGLVFLRSLPGRVGGGAIKVGPAGDFAEQFSDREFEVEVTSLSGECKEATLWFGSLRTCRRRATVLPSGATWAGPVEGGFPEVAELGGWLLEPDPALARSGLLDGFAIAHGLTRFAAGIDLFTADSPILSPFLTAFSVDDVLPLDLKTLRALVVRRGLGPLEIKTRGVDLRPESVRGSLRPRGPNPATVFLIGGESRGRAILASRVVAESEFRSSMAAGPP